MAILLAAGMLTATAAGAAETTASAAATTEASAMKPWPDPARYEKAIAKHEAANTTAPKGAVVAYGSSSIVGWHKWIEKDLAPVTVVPRGFGGSNMNDAIHFLDRAVLPLQPKAVLLYEGDNDISLGRPVDEVAGKYREFITRFHKALPDSRVYLIAVKPSISRWAKWPEMKRLNDELKKIANSDPKVEFIDVATPMLGGDGKPKPEIFLKDNLHMNRQGYDIWRDTVKPVLLKEQQ